jgi:hypothetical protein
MVDCVLNLYSPIHIQEVSAYLYTFAYERVSIPSFSSLQPFENLLVLLLSLFPHDLVCTLSITPLLNARIDILL